MKEEIEKLLSGDLPYAHVFIERRNPPYAHINLWVRMPRLAWNVPGVTIELSGQVGTDDKCGNIELFAAPYDVRAAIASHNQVTLDVAVEGIKYLKAFKRLQDKYEAGNDCRASFPVLAQMLLVACGCNHLIHEPDIGWEKWPHDLTEKAISPRGVASLRVFEKMASTLEDFARTC